ncbi:MAG: flagellar biosynthesis protein FlhB [Schwartzia sp.]|nr:flagellar biosynthesis protein FlhB [Schwartzia sp. (in: firmicutes)]
MGCMGIFRLSSETFDERCRLGAESFRFDLQLFAGEKTEDPTAKRQSDARAEGNIPRSQELSSTFVLLAGFWSLKVFGGYIYNEITVYFTYIYNHLNTTVDTETVMRLFLGIIILLGKTAFPILLIIMIFGLSVSLYQVGINFTTKPLELKFSWLNPINGFGRIFSKKSLVELLKSILKIIIIGYFIYSYLKDQILQMPKLLYLDINASLPLISDIILTLAFKVIGVIFVLSVFDYAYQKWDHFQSLKMSKDEVKEEFKQQEGDPQIKGKIKQKQRQMAMARMMQEVPKADVIVTNPTHFAVALKYQKGMKAPEVIAKGQDYVAQRIKDVAREAGVAIVEDKPLARALYAAVEIGEMVPPELYKSVAEVLAYVYRLKHRNYAA